MQRREFCAAATAALTVASVGLAASPPPRQVDIAPLRKSFRGPLLTPGDEGYDQARQVWNASIDRKPALIARCLDAEDVRAAVNFGRDQGLLIAVRCGGHSSAGNSVCDDGLMIDLSLMRAVRVEPARNAATVEGGALLGDFDRAAQVHGLATTTGTVSHTGVGGLTLGGGMGHLGRKYGLTIDSLLSADVVTADGKLLHASERENEDLFWGLRGGGGNFGIVTRFEFRVHPLGTRVAAAELIYPWPLARNALDFLAEQGPDLPDDATISPALVRTPSDMRFLSVGMHHFGPHDEAEKLLADMKAAVPPVNQPRLAVIPYLDYQSRFDEVAARRVHGYLKSGFIKSLSPAFIEAAMAAVEDPATPPLQPLIMVQMGGAIARIAPSATAFAHRDAAYAVLMDMRWDEAAQSEANVAWARKTWSSIEPAMRGGVYVNFTSGEDAQQRIREAYGPNYARMLELKRKFDPHNLFRLNANVDPAG